MFLGQQCSEFNQQSQGSKGSYSCSGFTPISQNQSVSRSAFALGPLANMSAAQQREEARWKAEFGRGRHRSHGQRAVSAAVKQGVAGAAATSFQGNTPAHYRSSHGNGPRNAAQPSGAYEPVRLLGAGLEEGQADESAAEGGTYRQHESCVARGGARGRRGGAKFRRQGGALEAGSAGQAGADGGNRALTETVHSALTAPVQVELRAPPVSAVHAARPARGGSRGGAGK